VRLESYKFSDKGQDMARNTEAALRFIQPWVNRLSSGDLDAAYLETLPAAVRQKQERAAKRTQLPPLAGTGLAPLALADADARAYLAGRQAFFDGGLVRVAADFWAGPKFRDQMIREARAGFHPGSGQPLQVNLVPARVPLWHQEGERFEMTFNALVPIMDREKKGVPIFLLEANVVVAAPVASLPAGPWYVERVELLRGYSAPHDRPPTGGAGRRR
jgi:hypothetical protein